MGRVGFMALLLTKMLICATMVDVGAERVL